jgi:hypothetical protein
MGTARARLLTKRPASPRMYIPAALWTRVFVSGKIVRVAFTGTSVRTNPRKADDAKMRADVMFERDRGPMGITASTPPHCTNTKRRPKPPGPTGRHGLSHDTGGARRGARQPRQRAMPMNAIRISYPQDTWMRGRSEAQNRQKSEDEAVDEVRLCTVAPSLKNDNNPGLNV